jgi:hypothetical protein
MQLHPYTAMAGWVLKAATNTAHIAERPCHSIAAIYPPTNMMKINIKEKTAYNSDDNLKDKHQMHTVGPYSEANLVYVLHNLFLKYPF